MWKLLVGGGLVAGAGYYLLRLRRTSHHLESITTARIHHISFKDIIIRIDVKLKNPAGGALSLKYPFVRLTYKGRSIGSSQVADRNITLPPHGETSITGITITIPLLNLTGLSKDLLKLLKGNPQGIVLQAVTITEIDIGIGPAIPYEKTESITLKKTADGAA